MTDQENPDNENAMAAEYVLRLLDVEEHAAFEVRLRDDPALRAEVTEWEAHFAKIAQDVQPVTPPSHVKASVFAALNPTTSSRKSTWKWFAGLGTFAAAVAVAVLFIGPVLRSTESLTPSFQSELVAADGSLVVTAGVIPATHEIVLKQLVGGAAPGRVLELWLIAQGASAPVSLGLLEAEGTTRIRVPDEIAPGVRTGTIAISDEPAGGSPTGAPTGAILATGTFVDL